MSPPRWELPGSWSWAAVADLGKIAGGGTPSARDPENFAETGIPWITPADLTGYSDVYISRGRRDLSEAGYASSGAQVMPAGTVLFSSRAPVGYCAIAANEIATNQGFKSVSLARGLVPEFLRHYLLASKVYAESLASGTTFLELSAGRFSEMAVPIPPVAEQGRIVAKLDALTARTARARADLDRIPALAARYKQAVLDAAYGGHLSDQPLGQLAVADVISSLDQGWSPKCDSEAAGEGQWGVIKTTAIQGVWFDDSANKRLPAHLEPRPAIKIVAGDVLITRAGPRSRVGVTCVVRQTRDRLMLCDKAYRLRVNLGVMDPVFLAFMLNSPQALRAIEEMKTGISDSGLNLTQGKLLALSLPVPPVEEQKRLVAKIDRAFAEIDRLTAEAAAARRQLDRLDQAVHAKAFRGELVPQDPADEPASVLLDRVRAELAATPKEKRAKRTAMA